MRLPESDTAVNEQRVVGARRQLRHGLTRRLGELIRRSDDEGVERVARVEAFNVRAARGRGGRARLRRDVGGGRVVDHHRHARMAAEAFGGGRLNDVEVMLDEPIARESVRRCDGEVVTFERKRAARAQPGVQNSPGELAG
jgi:hypothetical protein